jgi:hypothetical protein
LSFTFQIYAAKSRLPSDAELDEMIDRSTTTEDCVVNHVVGQGGSDSGAGETSQSSGRQNADDFQMVAPQSLRTFEGQDWGSGVTPPAAEKGPSVPSELKKLDAHLGTGLANGGSSGGGSSMDGAGSMADIAREWGEVAKRSRTSRFIEITDEHGQTHRVLKLNNYDLENVCTLERLRE